MGSVILPVQMMAGRKREEMRDECMEGKVTSNGENESGASAEGRSGL